MPSRAVALKLKGLERKYAELQRQVQRELQQQTQLLAKHLLLKGVCDGLSLFLGTKATVCLADGDHSDAISRQYEQRCAELQALEDELLVMLQGSSQTLAAAEAAQPQVSMDLGVLTVAPRHDPLAYFKLQLARPPVPDADTLTSADLACLLRDTVLESGVMLHQLQTNLEGVVVADCHESMGKLWTRYSRTAASLILSGRPDVVESVAMFNLSTLEPTTHNLSEAQAARYATLPPLLGLAPQQLQMVVVGLPLFQDLVQGVIHERQQLQAGLVAECSTPSGRSSSDSAHDPKISSSILSSVQEHMLEQDERNTCRLQALLFKDCVLRLAVCAWWVGTMSWSQLTLAASLVYPYPLRPMLLMMEIAKYAQQQLQVQPPAAQRVVQVEARVHKVVGRKPPPKHTLPQ